MPIRVRFNVITNTDCLLEQKCIHPSAYPHFGTRIGDELDRNVLDMRLEFRKGSLSSWLFAVDNMNVLHFDLTVLFSLLRAIQSR